ncbi:hypothetical protein C8J57DRAFT_1238764 [Mycena rebaudengoi]|nr:hypothetical protein C8J57DRAFT_1238764 [Mycena rebaudengoi]
MPLQKSLWFLFLCHFTLTMSPPSVHQLLPLIASAQQVLSTVLRGASLIRIPTQYYTRYSHSTISHSHLVKLDQLLATSPHIGALYIRDFVLQISGSLTVELDAECAILTARILPFLANLADLTLAAFERAKELPWITHVQHFPWETQPVLLKAAFQTALAHPSLGSQYSFAEVASLEYSILHHAKSVKRLSLWIILLRNPAFKRNPLSHGCSIRKPGFGGLFSAGGGQQVPKGFQFLKCKELSEHSRVPAPVYVLNLGRRGKTCARILWNHWAALYVRKCTDLRRAKTAIKKEIVFDWAWKNSKALVRRAVPSTSQTSRVKPKVIPGYKGIIRRKLCSEAGENLSELFVHCGPHSSATLMAVFGSAPVPPERFLLKTGFLNRIILSLYRLKLLDTASFGRYSRHIQADDGPTVLLEHLTLPRITKYIVDAMLSELSTVDIKHLSSLTINQRSMPLPLLKANAQTLQKISYWIPDSQANPDPIDHDILAGNESLHAIEIAQYLHRMAYTLGELGNLRHLKAPNIVITLSFLDFDGMGVDGDRDNFVRWHRDTGQRHRDNVRWPSIDAMLRQAGDRLAEVRIRIRRLIPPAVPDLETRIQGLLPSVAEKVSVQLWR